MKHPDQTRRVILRTAMGAAVTGASTVATAAMVITPRQSEGPFYPRQNDRFYDIDNDLVKIESEVKEAGGEILHLSGQVRNLAGQPIPEARVEIWQCDVNGRYLHRADHSQSRKQDPYFQGFGQSLTDDHGQYAFRTIKPVSYPGRTPHIHIKVIKENAFRTLTTQMYVEGEAGNDRDVLYRRMSEQQQRALTAKLQPDGDEYTGRFDLVIDV